MARHPRHHCRSAAGKPDLPAACGRLTGDNQRALYVPERFAHGYQALADDTYTTYSVGGFYTPNCEGGLMYNDAGLGLEWPLPVSEISDKDQRFPSLRAVEPELKRRMQIEAAATLEMAK